jgi:hypothetical protein
MKQANELDWLFDQHQIPEHTREPLVNFLMKGWEPGGFVTSMLAMDMERAVYAADFVNGPNIQKIARWIIEYCPNGSWGSYDQVEAWIKDINGRRTQFVEYAEKQEVWKILKDEA